MIERRSHKASGRQPMRTRAEQRAETARVDAETYARVMAGTRQSDLAREMGVSEATVNARVKRERERLEEARWARMRA